MFRKCRYISLENDTIRSLLVHYGIRQKGALVKEIQSFTQSLHVCVWGGRVTEQTTISGSSSLILSFLLCRKGDEHEPRAVAMTTRGN